MSSLFKPGFVYPRDHVGEYVELEGKIVAVDEWLPNELKIIIAVKGNTYVAYTRKFGNALPEIGDIGKIKHYDWGGGFYPDDVIIGWSKAEIVIDFKSTTLPKPKYEHGLVVPGYGAIYRREWRGSIEHGEWHYDCLMPLGLYGWVSEGEATRKLGL